MIGKEFLRALEYVPGELPIWDGALPSTAERAMSWNMTPLFIFF